MAKNRKKLSKKLEIKAENLGTVLKDRGILLDGISGDFILKEVELIRQDTEAFHLKKLELLESKEKPVFHRKFFYKKLLKAEIQSAVLNHFKILYSFHF
jgi:hypothetical protein